MHPEAYSWVRDHVPAEAYRVLDLGGRDINGTPRHLFPEAYVYRVLDIRPGVGVDIVADAATWDPDGAYDVVVSTETFEHAEAWPQICATAFRACRPGGWFIATAAGPGRAPHSGIDGGPVRPDEYYANVGPYELEATLKEVGFVDITVDHQPAQGDVRATARRPG